MHVMRRIDPKRFQMDFVTIKGEEGIYDAEIRALGGQLHACAPPSQKGAFLRDFREVLSKHGPYDVVHAHPFTFSGFILMQAARMGVPVRIVHSHTDRRKVKRDKSILRRIYGAVMRRLINKCATYGIAASDEAAVSLFGRNWAKDSRWNVMHCGIDLEPYAFLADKKQRAARRKKIAAAIGVPEKAHVIGHVGSFHFEKNHEFLIPVFEKIATKNLKAHLLLVGDGPLKERIMERVKARGLEKRVTFTGVRQDIPDILSVMDVFVFPSIFEGLGLSVIEAQAAGLPCLVSDQVPNQAKIVEGAVSFLPIDEGVDDWVSAIKAALNGESSGAKIDKARALVQVKSSPFNIEHNAMMLGALYESLSGKEAARHEA